MARHVNTGEYKVTRPNLYMCDPRGIAVDWRKNLARDGEEFDVTDPEFVEFAMSMLPMELGGKGQIEPICCRLIADDRIEVYVGFRRLRAALWLIEQGHFTEYKIAYVINDLSPEEAAIRNVVENLQRLNPKPIQLASAIRTLRDSYGMTDADIAKQMHRSVGWVQQTASLVRLPAEIKQSVAAGETTADAGKLIVRLPEDEQRIVFEEAKKTRGGKKINKEAVQDAARTRAEANGNGSIHKPPRTIRHLRVFLEDRKDGSTKDGRALARAILKYLEGELDEAKLQRLWDRDWAPLPKD